MFPVLIRKVDREGRVSLPKEWRERLLGKIDEVLVIEKEDSLVIRPKRKVDLTKYFDGVRVDIDPKEFEDYNRLKKALFGGESKE